MVLIGFGKGIFSKYFCMHVWNQEIFENISHWRSFCIVTESILVNAFHFLVKKVNSDRLHPQTSILSVLPIHYRSMDLHCNLYEVKENISLNHCSEI